MTSSFIKVTVTLLPKHFSSLFQVSNVNKNKYNNDDSNNNITNNNKNNKREEQ